MIYEWSKCYLEDHAIYSMPYKHGRREYEEGATTFRLPSNLLWMKQLLVIYQKLAGTIIFMPCVGEKTIFMSCHVWRGATRCRARRRWSFWVGQHGGSLLCLWAKCRGNSIYRVRGCQPSRRRSREAQEEAFRCAVRLFSCAGRWPCLFFIRPHLVLFHFPLGQSVLIKHMLSYLFASSSVLGFLHRGWYGIRSSNFTIILILKID